MKERYNYSPKITSASVLVTEDCTNACEYCFERHNHNTQTMSIEVVRQTLNFLFKQAKDNESDEIVVTLFGGEPTMKPKVIKEFFEYGLKLRNKYKKRYVVEMITNCVLMTDELYNIFNTYKNEVNNFTVQLSIDGNEKTHDRYRKLKNGEGSFKHVLKNIPKWHEIFKENPYNLTIHGCLTKETLPELYDNYIFFKYVLEILLIWFLPIAEEKWDDQDVLLYDKQMNKITNHILDRVKLNKNVDEFRFYSPLDKCLKGYFTSEKSCGAGNNYVSITANGDIYPCHQFYFNDEHNEMKIGDVWSGVDDDKRRMFLEYDKTDLNCENDCECIDSCYRCIAANWTKYKTIFTQSKGFYCDLMKIDKKYQEKLKREGKKMGILNDKGHDCCGQCECNDYENIQCNNHTPIVLPGQKCDVVSWDNGNKKVSDYEVKEEEPQINYEINETKDNLYNLPEREVFSLALTKILELLQKIDEKLSKL